mgnify:FL=1
MASKTPVISPAGVRASRIVAVLRMASAVFAGAALVGVAGIADGRESFAGPLACACAAGLAAFAEILFGGHAARAEERRIRRSLLSRLFASRSREDSGAHAVQLLTDNVERATEYRQIYLGSTLAALLIPFVVLAYISVSFDPVLGLTVMALCPLIPVLLAVFMRFFRKTSAKSRKERAVLAGKYLDAIRNLVTIRLLGAGPRIERQLKDQGERNRGAIMKLLAGNQLVIIVVDGLFSLILICATCTLAVVRFNAGAVTASQVLATVLLTALLIEPLAQVAGFFYIGMGGIASQRAIRAYIDNHSDPSAEGAAAKSGAAGDAGANVDAATQAEAGASGDLGAEGDADEGGGPGAVGGVGCPVVVRNVSFDYGRGEVLHGVDLAVASGSKIAVVGRSGGGKSTLMGLMGGMLRPARGSVLIDGKNLAFASAQEAAALTARVAQTTWLFTGTIADNLRLAKEDATPEEMWNALRGAQIADEIERMPEGIDTDVGEQGAFLSGGQAQRISIARALLSGRRILLLDEPTSQVDIESEARIVDALRSLGRDLTVVLVTHRSALLDVADKVYEMKDGMLFECAEKTL